MSFDPYFVPRPSDGRWDDALDELERAAADGAELSSQDPELWAPVVGAVTAVFPEAEEIGGVDGAAHRRLDDGVAVQVNMSPGELRITTPYCCVEGREAASSDRAPVSTAAARLESGRAGQVRSGQVTEQLTMPGSTSRRIGRAITLPPVMLIRSQPPVGSM